MSTSNEEWSKNYVGQLHTPPQRGAILRAAGVDGVARLDLDLVKDRPPFLYARAYVPAVVGCELGWCLQDYESNDSRGWKIIILPKSREAFLKKMGPDKIRTKMPVKALRIVKESRTGSSLLAEIYEYADDLEITPPLNQDVTFEVHQDVPFDEPTNGVAPPHYAEGVTNEPALAVASEG